MRVWGPELWSPEPSDMLAGHGSLPVTTAWEGSYGDPQSRPAMETAPGSSGLD